MAATLLINVQNAVVRFGDKTLFDNLSFSLCEGEKICLIGKNGAGKTTLMNIIRGLRDLDEGVHWRLQGTTVGYLQQEVAVKPNQTVRDFIFEEIQNKDGSQDYKIDCIIAPLGLSVEDKMDALSGGQLRRAALARALVEDTDILLLDEPTNHLDLEVIEWLENYLKSYRGTVLCISHDRAFLKNISDKVFWLDRGRLRVCPKGYGYFDEWAAMVLEQEERELHNRQKVLDQEVEWASRGVKARRKRNVRRVELMKEEREKLRRDKNALSRMLAKIDFQPMETVEASSRIAAAFFNVSKLFVDGDKETVILNALNLRIQRGDRIGIVGRNGSGKTSFLKMLVGELKQDAGVIKVSKNLEFSYFDQKRAALRPDYTLHRILCPNGSDYIDVMGKTRHVCGYLKDFLFDPRAAFDDVATLSGGQKNRLLLAKVLANPGSFLILDEPTNDLDMDTMDMLEDMLSSYTGTLLVVSHDRDFLDQTVSKILIFEGNGKVDAVIGGYQDYLDKRRTKEGAAQSEAAKKSPKASVKDVSAALPKEPSQKLTFTQRFELKKLPEQMEVMEGDIAALEPLLADPDLYSRDPQAFRQMTEELADTRVKLHAAEERWLELEALRIKVEGE